MQSPIQFLLTTLFDLYAMVVLLRFFLQLFRVDFYNPLSQFVVKVTNPLLVPMRKVIPGIGGVDISSLILAYLVVLTKFFLYNAMAGLYFSLGMIIVFGLADLLNQIINLIFWLVLIRVIMSWVSPGLNNPFMMVIYQVTEPIMAPVRRIMPPMGGLDLSPIVLIIGLQFLMMAISSWIFTPLMRMFA